jgi:CylI protein
LKAHKANITGIGIVSSIGGNYAEHADALLGLRRGIVKERFFNQGQTLESFVGKIDPSELENKYGKQRYNNLLFALAAFDEAVTSAHIDFSDYDNIALCIGTSLGGKTESERLFYDYMEGKDTGDAEKYRKNDYLQNITDTIQERYGFTAAVFVISTACSASNNAAILAERLIASGDFDLVIAGGTDELADISISGFSTLSAINEEAPCDPYSSFRGINLGEGAGFVVVEPDAEGKRVYAEIIAGDITSDGYHITAPDPKGAGALGAIDNTLERARLAYGDIDYVNGHGTGTMSNDKMEIHLLSSKFGDSALISSTKSFTGHTLGAAGIIEIISTIAMMGEQKVIGTLNSEESLAISTAPACFVKNKIVPRPIRYALNLSFAFGGNNSCVLLGLPGGSPKEGFVPAGALRVAGYASSETSGTEFIVKRWGDPPIDVFKASRLSPRKGVNPRVFSGLDDYSKLVANIAYDAIIDAGKSPRDLIGKKVGLLFSTFCGPQDSIEKVENDIPRSGYKKVSASTFPYTVFNAASGIVSLLFKIHGPVSVISYSNTNNIDAFNYAKYIASADALDYMLVISANTLSDFMIFENQVFNPDYPGRSVPKDFVSASFISFNGEKARFEVLDSVQRKIPGQDASTDVVFADMEYTIADILEKCDVRSESIEGFISNLNLTSHTGSHRALEKAAAMFPRSLSSGIEASGSGDCLDILVCKDTGPGYYLYANYSIFGGYSLMLARKEMP